MEPRQKAKEIISTIAYITIATVSKDGRPWNTPVFSAYDDDYNFYWGSYRESQHSRNIRANKHIFFVVYDSTAVAGTGEAVYIEAVAAELSDTQEISFAHKLLQERRPVPYWELKHVQGDAPIRIYRAVPKRYWLNSEAEVDGVYIDTRVEIKLMK